MKIAITSMVYTGNYIPYVNVMYDSLKNKLKSEFDVILFVTDNIDKYYIDQLSVPYRLVHYYNFKPQHCRGGSIGDYYIGTINKFYWASLVDEYDYIVQLDADLIPTLDYSDSKILELIAKYPEETLISTKRYETYDKFSPETGWTLTGTQYIVNLNAFKKKYNFKDIVEISIDSNLCTDEQVMNYWFDVDKIAPEMRKDIHTYLASMFYNDSITGVVKDNIYISKNLCNNNITYYRFFIFLLTILGGMSTLNESRQQHT